MGIVSTKITDSSVQASGIQRVRVAFTDHLAKVHNRGFDFPAGVVVADEIQKRISNVENGLKDQEIENAVKIVESGKPFPSLEFATTEEVKAAMEESIAEKDAEIARLTSEKTELDNEVK